MENSTTNTWIEVCQESILQQREKLNKLEESFEIAKKPSKDIGEAVKRLNLLLKLFNSNPMYCDFPTIDIMKELLKGQDYYVQEFDDKVSFIIDVFKLELMPGKNKLMVNNIHRADRLAALKEDAVLQHRTSEDFGIVDKMRRKMIFPVEAAKQLAQVSINHGEVNNSKSGLILETIKNYFALKLTKKANKIYDAWNEEYEKIKDSYRELKKESDEVLVQEIKTMKSNGLYDILKIIEKESDCFVTFNIFNDTHGWEDDLQGVDNFLNKKNSEQEENI